MDSEKGIDKESLLAEYKIIHDKHDYFGRMLWQMATIFLTASLAGFAFGVQQDLPLNRFIPLNLVLSALLIVFFLQARRLGRLAHLYLLRGREIEKILPIKITSNHLEEGKKGIVIDGVELKRQRITGRWINQGIPWALLIIF